MLYAWHSHLVKNAEELVNDFAKALSLENIRKQNWDKIPRLTKHPSRVFYSDVVKLDRQTQRYIDLFGPDKVHIVIYDDIVANTDMVLKDILNFLSVDNVFTPDFTIRNPNRVPRLMWLNKLRGSKLSYRTENYFQSKLPSGMYKNLRKISVLNTSKTKRKPLDTELKKRLMNTNATLIQNLSEITGRDLVHCTA